jgi:hypothetical protein
MSHWHPQVEIADQSRAHHERWRSSHDSDTGHALRADGSIAALLEDRFTEWCNESFAVLKKTDGNK